MAVSYWLLAATAVLMVIDYRQTIAGLRGGAKESNAVPAALEAWLGPRGLLIFQGTVFAVLGLMVIPNPEQWSAPLIALISIGVAVTNNALVLQGRLK